MRYICRLIWDYCEARRINLGWLAPYIFGGMLGRWPRRIR